MIYHNMERFKIASVDEVVKVGDTVADVREGKNAGVRSLSVLGLSQDEYEAILAAAREKLLQAGADAVLLNLTELPVWLENNG